jgi:hypothetical protein
MLDGRTTSPPTIPSGHPRRPRIDRGHPQRSRRLVVAALVPTSGCGLAPSINVLGSFFPAWLLCIIVGVVLTIVTLRVLGAMQIAPHLEPAALVYPCLVAFWIFATWLLLFGS